MIGGFDNNPEGVLYSGSREEVEAETKKILDKAGTKGVILGADCTVPKDIDPVRFEWVRKLLKNTRNKDIFLFTSAWFLSGMKNKNDGIASVL